MIKVSVIMPVLNGMPYFKDALDSVIGQSLIDIEIIVVDAGSDDGTLEYVEECIKKDSRIRVINSEKRSFGYQQNIGIEAAKGHYIGFCESDDHLSEDMMESLYKAVEDNDYPDFVKMNYVNFFKSGDEEYTLPVRVLNDIPQCYGKVMRGPASDSVFYTDISYWCGIYKREFVVRNKILFNETPGASFQDMGFLLQTLLNARTSLYIDKLGYNYRRDNPGASSHAIQKGKFCAWELLFFLMLMRERHFTNMNVVPCALRREFGDFVASYSENLVDGNSDKYSEDINELHRRLCDFISSCSYVERVYYSDIPYINLFVEDLSLFEEVISKEYLSVKRTREAALKEIKKYSKAVIFGKGETGNSVEAYLRVNGYEGEIVFCDNNQSKINDKDVFAVDSAVHRFPMACFLITNKKYAFDMQKQLLKKGVDLKEIILCAGITPFNANEIAK